MKNRLNPLVLILISLGIVGGFGYYYFVGCASGTCPLKSNPWIMMAYGGLIGYLSADIVQWIIKKVRKTQP